MTGGFSVSTNLHSPGPIGDVTRSSIAFTTSTFGAGDGFDYLFQRDSSAGYAALEGQQSGFVGLWIRESQTNGVGVLVLGKMGGSNPAFLVKNNTTRILIRNGADSADAPIQASKLTISAIPTSSSGLSSGDVYSNLGVLTIVP